MATMLSVSRQSLVEQKKAQWAQEREEMSRLYIPWDSNRYHKQPIRNQFVSTLELHKHFDYQDPIPQRQRSPSLPPIPNPETEDLRKKDVLNRNISSPKRFTFYDEDAEGDTSGYGSETFNNMSKKKQSQDDQNSLMAWQDNGEINGSKYVGGESGSPHDVWTVSKQRISSGMSVLEEGRPKWGDRGVATGRLWEPHEADSRLPQMPAQKRSTPSWVERSLNKLEGADALVIDQHSNSSGFDCDRFSSNGSDEGRSTFLRGQNAPVEPEVRIEREHKRMKALELQTAIKYQLEDKEKRRREETERRLQEEKLEEIRLQKQQAEEKRRADEAKLQKEQKLIIEQRKLEALEKALQAAEISAREDKQKRFTNMKQNYENKISSHEEPNQIDNSRTNVNLPKGQPSEVASIPSKDCSPKKSNETCNSNSSLYNEYLQKDDRPPDNNIVDNSPQYSDPSKLNFYIHNIPPISLQENQLSFVPINLTSDIAGSQSNIQLAVLIPQTCGNTLNISLNSINTDQSSGTAKVLTPRKYRGQTKDATTQTEPQMFDSKEKVDKMNETFRGSISLDKDYSTIDENAPQEISSSMLKKERRYRSEERLKKELENRPKWGVNKPIAQYKKQSEKDPFYGQKRKTRQKYRPQTRPYLSHSSDDSRSPSPLQSEHSNVNTKKRSSHTQSYWRNRRPHLELFKPSTASIEQINIAPIHYDHLGQVLIGEQIVETKVVTNRSPSNKRLTLSQKFINDKYGNRKLYSDDFLSDCNLLTLTDDGKDRKKKMDQINLSKRNSLGSNIYHSMPMTSDY